VNGQPATHPTTAAQVEQLLKIDHEFFSKMLKFYERSARVNALEDDSIGNRCHFFSHLGTIGVLGQAQAIVIPDEAATNSRLWNSYRALGVRVVKQSEAATIASDDVQPVA
jgi:hypothetical protein